MHHVMRIQVNGHQIQFESAEPYMLFSSARVDQFGEWVAHGVSDLVLLFGYVKRASSFSGQKRRTKVHMVKNKGSDIGDNSSPERGAKRALV